MRFLKRLSVALIILSALLGGLGYLAILNIDAIVTRYREPLERWVGAELGGELRSKKVTAHLLPRPQLQIEEASVRFSGEEPALLVERIRVEFELAPLLWRNLKLNSVVLSRPHIFLVRSERGVTPRGMTPRELGGARSLPLFIGLDRFEVNDGRIEFGDGAESGGGVIAGIELSGGMRLEDGELEISPFEAKARGADPLGEVAGSFREVRYSTKSGELSIALTRGVWRGIEFQGDGGFRLVDSTGRFALTGPPASVALLDSAAQKLGFRLLPEGDEFKIEGTAEPKLTVTFERGGRYRINGSLGLEGAVSRDTLAVQGLKGVVQLALHEGGGRIAVEKLRGVVGGEKSPLSAEGAFELNPLRGEIRGGVSGLPLSAVSQLVPASSLPGLSLEQGAAALKFSFQARGDVPAEWNVQADVTGGAGTFRATPFQDGAGRIRVRGSSDTFSLTFDPITLGLAGGAEVVTIKGEGDGSSGGFSISTVQVSVPTVLAALGVSAEGSSGVSGDLKFDLKARIQPGGALNIAGPLTITNGGWDIDGLSVRELAGEIKLEYAEAAKIDLRGLNFQVNGEPLVMSGIMKKVGEELRCEQCLIQGVGGQALFDGAVSLVTPGRFEFTGRGQDLNIERLRRVFSVDTAGDALTGELTDLRWRFSGNRGEEFSRSLEGGLAFRLERGALHGVNIARVAIERIGTIPLLRDPLLESIPPQFRGSLYDTDTPIRGLLGEVSVREGRASTEELRLESDLFALGARGEYEFDGAVNLGATLWLEREFAYALADRVVELRSLFGREGTIVVPLKISGAPTELTVTPDIGVLLERAAQRAIERGAERFIGEAIDRLGGRESREP